MKDVDSVVSTSTEEPVRPSTVKEPEPTALTVPWTPSRDRSWLAAAREGRSPEPLPASATPPVVSSDAEARTATPVRRRRRVSRSEEHTSELQSLMRISYAVFCLNKK